MSHLNLVYMFFRARLAALIRFCKVAHLAFSLKSNIVVITHVVHACVIYMLIYTGEYLPGACMVT